MLSLETALSHRQAEMKQEPFGLNLLFLFWGMGEEWGFQTSLHFNIL